MGPFMLCEAPFPLKSFIALVALERSFTSVCHHVLLQITKNSESIGALVTFERLFTGVFSHPVNFQLTGCYARILTHSACLQFFPKVRLPVLHQVACVYCFIFTLIALVEFSPGVFLDMCFEGVASVA